MTFNKTLLTLLVSAGIAVTAHAGVNGNSSDPGEFHVSGPGGDPHGGGNVAFSIVDFSPPWNTYVGFTGIASAYGNTETNVSGSGYDVIDIPDTIGYPPGHANFGNFAFVKVPTATGKEVYFGEWAPAGDTFADSTHVVYYGGDNDGRSVPNAVTGGVAEYDIVGLNGYDVISAQVLTGTATADFSNASTGFNASLSGGTVGSTASVSISGAAINAGAGTFSGGSVSGTKVTSLGGGAITGGSATGHFFGSNGSAETGSIAGIVTFTEHAKFDVAFGGHQTDYTP